MKVGYVRVSTFDQNLERQIDELKKHGCETIFQDKCSGLKSSRPEFDKMLKYNLRDGDQLVVLELFRLGRSLLDLIKVLDELKKRDITIITLKEGINTSTSMGKAMFQMAGIFAEIERDYIIERTKSGLKAAHARGRRGGRKPKLTARQKKLLLAIHRKAEWTPEEIRKHFGIGKTTYYAVLKE